MPRSFIKKSFKVIGILAFFESILSTSKDIEKKTETEIISAEVLELLKDKVKTEKLNKAVEKYQESNKWEETELNTVL